MDTLAARFFSKIKKNSTGCWEWTGFKNLNGYGKLMGSGRGARCLHAHRVSYTLHKGLLPENTELDHICRNRGCVNPDHLEPVTHQENMRRAASAGTLGRKNSKKSHCHRGHSFTGKNKQGARICRECININAGFRRNNGS